MKQIFPELICDQIYDYLLFWNYKKVMKEYKRRAAYEELMNMDGIYSKSLIFYSLDQKKHKYFNFRDLHKALVDGILPSKFYVQNSISLPSGRYIEDKYGRCCILHTLPFRYRYSLGDDT